MPNFNPERKAVWLSRLGWIIVLTGYSLLGYGWLHGIGGYLVLGLMAFLTIYAIIMGHNIQDPDVGRAYNMGEIIAALGPGLYMGIPYFLVIELVSRRWVTVRFEDDDLNPMNDVEAGVESFADRAIAAGVMQIRPLPDVAALRESAAMPIGTMGIDGHPNTGMVGQAAEVCKSKLHTRVSGGMISELLKSISTIRKGVEKDLGKRCADFGHEYRGFELDLGFPNIDQRADGRRRAMNAQDLGEALKENWPAATATSVNEGLSSLERIAALFLDGRTRNREEKGGTDALLERIADKLETATGGGSR